MEELALEMLAGVDLSAAGAKIINALSVVLGLGLVIFFHELGHFAVAKWCNVHVERFSIGIGPILWSRQKGETEYALSALPFGGYVKMLGQDDMDPNQMTSDEIAENPRSYSSKKVWQRMAIISAGVIMNIVTGFMFFAIAFRSGVQELVPVIGAVHAGMPAWEAGIRPGDVIEKINDWEIQNFTDITQAVVLSSGSLQVEGHRADGSPLSEVVTPNLGDLAREIGISPASSARIDADPSQVDLITMAGLAAERASEPFLPGDRVVAVNGKPVHYLHEIARETARLAAEEITYTVKRRVVKDGDNSAASPSGETQTVMIRIPPKPMKSVGLLMAPGPITSVVRGSIAEQAGLKLRDQIRMVDNLVVGKDIDPLRLPNYFADRAGKPVEVTVSRLTDNKGDVEEKITVVPDDYPAWLERPFTLESPLPISCLGIGIQVLPRIAHIVPGSAAAAEARLAEGQKIVRVELEHPDPNNIKPDLLGDQIAPKVIDLTQVEEPNWAHIFDSIQLVPNRNIRLHIAAEEGTEAFAVVLSGDTPETDWFMSMRGIDGWERETLLRKAEHWSEASSLAMRQTKSSLINIYMTLRSLIVQNLSVRALSGPLGIVSIGTKIADFGLAELLKFLGFLSINLAVLNFLPIPVLDGGHMVFLIWEAVARRKPSPRVINFAHGIGLIFIISLFIFVLYLDIFVNKLGFGG
ncbi:MAG: RIP metalloprotease RseP [Planctomycetaceae bacterium]|nr:RIP metalloprotease RseP [Planctomycetaceae bacterium]